MLKNMEIMNCVKPKIFLRYILLYKLYINMAIRHISVYRNSFYDRPGPKYKHPSDRTP